MKKSLAVAGVLALSLGATTAFADTERGWYIGGGVGEVNVNIDDFDDLSNTIDRYDSNDTAYKLFAGWRFNPAVALELDYINYGSPSDQVSPTITAQAEVEGYAPFLIATLPVGPVELFAKAGYLFYDIDLEARSPLGTFRRSFNGEEFAYGGGIGFTVLERLNLRLDYEIVDIDEADDFNSLWLTAAWRF